MSVSTDNWTERAACDGRMDVFGPTISRHPDREAVAEAKKICASCPVRGDCLLYAIENGEDLGVWGQTLPEERDEMMEAIKEAS